MAFVKRNNTKVRLLFSKKNTEITIFPVLVSLPGVQKSKSIGIGVPSALCYFDTYTLSTQLKWLLLPSFIFFMLLFFFFLRIFFSVCFIIISTNWEVIFLRSRNARFCSRVTILFTKVKGVNLQTVNSHQSEIRLS